MGSFSWPWSLVKRWGEEERLRQEDALSYETGHRPNVVAKPAHHTSQAFSV